MHALKCLKSWNHSFATPEDFSRNKDATCPVAAAISSISYESFAWSNNFIALIRTFIPSADKYAGSQPSTSLDSTIWSEKRTWMDRMGRGRSGESRILTESRVVTIGGMLRINKFVHCSFCKHANRFLDLINIFLWIETKDCQSCCCMQSRILGLQR